MTASKATALRPPQPADLEVCLKGPAAKRAALFILRTHQREHTPTSGPDCPGLLPAPPAAAPARPSHLPAAAAAAALPFAALLAAGDRDPRRTSRALRLSSADS
eukprot:EG_transcript_59483